MTAEQKLEMIQSFVVDTKRPPYIEHLETLIEKFRESRVLAPADRERLVEALKAARHCCESNHWMMTKAELDACLAILTGGVAGEERV